MTAHELHVTLQWLDGTTSKYGRIATGLMRDALDEECARYDGVHGAGLERVTVGNGIITMHRELRTKEAS